MLKLIPSTSSILERIRNKRLVVVRRYSSVAHQLPDGAKEVLYSKVGNIEVTARDSFEIFLVSLGKVTPKDNYMLFCKRFAEIFDKKAHIVLKKIKKNRDNQEDFYVSNEYFGQEFIDLFKVQPTYYKKLGSYIYKIEKGLGIGGNIFIKEAYRLFQKILRSGLIRMMKARFKGSMVRSLKIKPVDDEETNE